jgi:hypothetical protein
VLKYTTREALGESKNDTLPPSKRGCVLRMKTFMYISLRYLSLYNLEEFFSAMMIK